MKKVTCDRCGKESNTDMNSHWIYKLGGDYETFDLCSECEDKYTKIIDDLFMKFIKEGK